MEIYKLIEAENKAVSIIESCENGYHLSVAQIYINRFREMYENEYSFSKLQLLLNNKHKKII
tara:strand:- start:1869 stop:2054 length:186 start_codon:yes stop_codon:yes gene_type:complete